ncbi:MAG: hypothetical protein D6681_17335 [Calditrichaeota bacterium]|nr:MAG: hypothetical protein D6681_17335 [Calditrichota bacterium]
MEKPMRQILALAGTAAFLMLLACNAEKFTGYNYDADFFAQTAHLSGVVQNRFTGEPVSEARVQVGTQEAFTAPDGSYTLNYVLTEDDLAGKPTPVRVQAPNFFSLTSEAQLFPREITLNFELEYAAPIIVATTRAELTYTQAIVFDYQGLGNIETVMAHFSYFDSATGRTTIELDVPMTLSCTVGDSGYYEYLVAPQHPEYGTISNLYQITVRDRDGFSTAVTRVNSVFAPDTLLFPVGCGGE